MLKYIELKTGYNDNGPAWIARVKVSKSGRTIYFNGRALKQSSSGSGNFVDLETRESFWVSGIKRDGTDRHWAGSGKILVEAAALDEYLVIVGKPELDKSRFAVRSRLGAQALAETGLSGRSLGGLNPMAWFLRDHTGRVLRRFERDFVDALGGLLAQLAAPQVDEHETALTAERNICLIVLIPHRALGGVSIVVWLFEDRAKVTWAQVAALDCCHDALDLGISVARFRLDSASPNFSPLLECIRKQINEPLTLRCFGNDRAIVLVRDHAGKLRKVGEVGNPSGWSDVFRRADPTDETVIRLSDPEPPPVTSPSGVERWFDSGGHGA